MELSPEEKFNHDLWYVLQAIRKQSLYTVGGQNIKYRTILMSNGGPHKDDQKAIIEKLNEWGAITLGEKNGEFGRIEDGLRVFYIKSTNPKFAPLYRLFENAIQEKVDAKRIFLLVKELLHPVGQDKDLSFELWRLTQKSDGPDKKKSAKILPSLLLPNIQFIYKLSAENRSKIKRLIELIQNKLELVPLNRLTGEVKIPVKLLENEGYSLSEVELLVERIDMLAEHSFIKVQVDNYPPLRPVYLAEHASNNIRNKNGEKEYLILNLTNAPTLQDVRDHIDNFEMKLEEMASKLEKNTHANETSKSLLSVDSGTKKEVFYNPKTGIGEINFRQFRIKPSDTCFDVFASLYGIINSPLSREEVLILSGFYKEGEKLDPARSKSETLHINEIAKTIRRILKVDVNTLINNDGNLTLIGSKIKPPKVNQTAPK